MSAPTRASWISLIVILLSACGTLPANHRSAPCADLAGPAGGAPAAEPPAGSHWLCQLQGAEPEAIAASGFDIVVIDYSRDGGEDGRYSRDEMDTLKHGGGFTRRVIAYLSVGEAEEYRYYFESGWVSEATGQPAGAAPCWLARTNPDWRGNFKVQYWSEEWQRIVLDYLDRIVADGFDGVYLDIIDAFEYWSDPGNGEGFYLAEREAAVRMINFVKRVAFHARVTRGAADFLVIPQNAERLLRYDSGIDYLGEEDFLSTISGVGVEDLYYYETSRIRPSVTAERRVWLDAVRQAGKAVLVMDYVDAGIRPVPSAVTNFRRKALEDGYLPYAARKDRRLDEVNSFPGQPRPQAP